LRFGFLYFGFVHFDFLHFGYDFDFGFDFPSLCSSFPAANSVKMLSKRIIALFSMVCLKIAFCTPRIKAFSGTPLCRLIRITGKFQLFIYFSKKFSHCIFDITGLYKSIVIIAFIPPFIRLNGRNAGISSSTTASLGQPI